MKEVLEWLKKNKAKVLTGAGIIVVIVTEGATGKNVIELLSSLLDMI